MYGMVSQLFTASNVWPYGALSELWATPHFNGSWPCKNGKKKRKKTQYFGGYTYTYTPFFDLQITYTNWPEHQSMATQVGCPSGMVVQSAWAVILSMARNNLGLPHSYD